MKEILTFIILICCLQIYGQKSDFDKLLYKYGQRNNELDSIQLKKYFDVNLNPDLAPSGYADKIIFTKPNMIGLSCNIPCTAGGACKSSKFRIFDYAGNILDKLDNFEYTFSDCQDYSERYCAFGSDSIIILVDEKSKTDCNTDSLLKLDISFCTYTIDSLGKISELNKNDIDTRRNYFIASTKLLIDSDLKNKTKQDLATMRNEIFAAHGYIFKTYKWSDFFKTKDWYSPIFENVDKYLTIIERENINMIKKYEQQVE